MVMQPIWITLSATAPRMKDTSGRRDTKETFIAAKVGTGDVETYMIRRSEQGISETIGPTFMYVTA
jgi:hypothetical protein